MLTVNSVDVETAVPRCGLFYAIIQAARPLSGVRGRVLSS